MKFYRVSSDPTMRLLGWNVAAEDLVQIPEHWLTYEEPEASMHYLLALLYIAFTFFGNFNWTLSNYFNNTFWFILTSTALTGNGLVIWVFSA